MTLKITCTICRLFFASQGFEVLTAHNGLEALGLARREPPDLIISDILMPVMDGFKLCGEWKKDDLLKNIPFIIYTATYTHPNDEKLALSLGADRFIIKLQEPDVLIALVQNVMADGVSERETAGAKAKETVPWEAALEEYNEVLFRKLEDKIKQLERLNQVIRESEESYRSIFDNSIEGIYQTTREGKFLKANIAFCNMLGYRSFEELASTITDIQKQLYVDPGDREKILRLLEGKGVIKGFENRFRTKDGGMIWANINIRTVRDKDGNLLCYEGIGEDITQRKQAEEKLARALETLRQSFNATTRVIASVVEMRDPYTAGHQERVSSLARAIAKQMNITDGIIDGIVAAGLIHDLGKISIPAETLSKPGKLSPIEFALIKTHPQRGHEIVKDVDFPWPVADMILQHHERLNGSGYPSGLKGDDILLESRILMVADVVEAMASHRPYRPALGIEVAVEEIEKNSGILYDKEVVDACMELLRNGKFRFE